MVKYVKNNSKTTKEYARRFPRGNWSFPGARIWKEVVRNSRTQTRWILGQNCRENAAELRRIRSPDIPSHQCFRGDFRSKGSGKKSIHFNDSTKNIELPLETVISVNQLSIYGAVADMIEELPVGQRAVVKRKHQANWIKLRFLHNLFLQKCKPMKSDRETCCKKTSNDLKNCQKTRSYPDHAPKQVWDQSKLDNASMLFRHQEEKEINLYAENLRCLEIKKELVSKGGSKAMCDLVPSRT